MAERLQFDGVLVIGAGLAGLAAALAAAPRRALVLTPFPLTEATSSAWAQGGVAAALSADDNPALHAADTIAAGAGLTDPAVAELLAAEGPDAVRWLAQIGAPFDRTPDGGFSQSLEAAHSRPRVARVKGDQAGKEVMRAVSAYATAAGHIEIREGVRARALLQDDTGRVRGVLAQTPDGPVEIIAPATVLATGGVGGLYAVTTNPPQALGEGVALAASAGATIADPEFVQFHPTAINVGVDPAPLATEALRGEGGFLIDGAGRRFMEDIHPLGDLAPRDVVARAVHEMVVSGRGAFLDAREAVGDHFPDHFPFVFSACMAAGLDPREQPIPIAPAAHYHMGGIATDVTGATSLPGLFAAGECACTGVHGANRLASNSLLEAAVFGRRAGMNAAALQDALGEVPRAEPLADLPYDQLQALRRGMARDGGVVRDRAGLERLLGEIADLRAEHPDAMPLITAEIVAVAALERQESRGAHYRSDYPKTSATAARTFLDVETDEDALAQPS